MATTGTNNNDVLSGGTGNDRRIGNAGEDRLTDGAGRDTLSGRTQLDHFHFHAINESGARTSTRDVITDFTRNSSPVTGDLIDLSIIDARIRTFFQCSDPA